ncbi:MAG TPA: flagellar hook-basal body complex protein FliE [Candidatus Saccharimonadales bacterium]|nr:flagellar hook-basal body complex protein FliE [Candidatus Saccharimonadales bacterium]
MSPIAPIPYTMPSSGLMPDGNIIPSSPIGQPEQPQTLPSAQPADNSFSTILGRMVDEVNNTQLAAANAVETVQNGGNVSLHQAVIAMEEANVSFQLMVEVRNKLLDAYKELMQMQI